MRKWSFFFVVVSLLVTTVTSVQAQSTGTFGLRTNDPAKGYFTYTLVPGASIEDQVQVTNESDQDLRLVVQVVDGHTASTGGTAYEFNKPVLTGRWVSFPAQGIIEVPAHSAKPLPFSVTVPTDAKQGEYVAGFLAKLEKPEDPPDSGGFVAKVINQVGLSVIVTVPGPASCSVKISSVSGQRDGDRYRMDVQIRNTGQTHFEGMGLLTLTHPSDPQKIAVQKNFPIGFVVPGDEIPYPLDLELPQPGIYWLSASVMTSDTTCQDTYTQADFAITPEDLNGGDIRLPQVAPKNDPLVATQQALLGVLQKNALATLSAHPITDIEGSPSGQPENPQANPARPQKADFPAWIFVAGGALLLIGGIPAVAAIRARNAAVRARKGGK